MDVAEIRSVLDGLGIEWEEDWGGGRLIFEIYDKQVQSTLVGPMFVVGYPTEISPLARRSPDDPTLADRFELLIGGRELANGYSELNDAVEQRQRFEHEAELVARGDVEAHPADMEFLAALELGLPPTGGIGIGVDRLVMLLAGAAAIRDVILFPILRPEQGPRHSTRATLEAEADDLGPSTTATHHLVPDLVEIEIARGDSRRRRLRPAPERHHDRRRRGLHPGPDRPGRRVDGRRRRGHRRRRLRDARRGRPPHRAHPRHPRRVLHRA